MRVENLLLIVALLPHFICCKQCLSKGMLGDNTFFEKEPAGENWTVVFSNQEEGFCDAMVLRRSASFATGPYDIKGTLYVGDSYSNRGPLTVGCCGNVTITKPMDGTGNLKFGPNGDMVWDCTTYMLQIHRTNRITLESGSKVTITTDPATDQLAPQLLMFEDSTIETGLNSLVILPNGSVSMLNSTFLIRGNNRSDGAANLEVRMYTHQEHFDILKKFVRFSLSFFFSNCTMDIGESASVLFNDTTGMTDLSITLMNKSRLVVDQVHLKSGYPHLFSIILGVNSTLELRFPPKAYKTECRVTRDILVPANERHTMSDLLQSVSLNCT